MREQFLGRFTINENTVFMFEGKVIDMETFNKLGNPDEYDMEVVAVCDKLVLDKRKGTIQIKQTAIKIT